jgi:type I restriction enzyme M protein
LGRGTVTSIRTETETVIKRILPYLRRRGYDPETDIDFETPVRNLDRYSKGYVDLLVTCGKATPHFVIEAKRNGKRLTSTDAKQARNYGASVKAPFVVVTNGMVVQVFNTETGEPLKWNGRLADKVPSRDQVDVVVKFLRTRKDASDVPLGTGDESLPFRPSLPLKQLNDLFARCHNKIRNIEKNEEHAFADFSKLLFLKLLEEKADAGDFSLPYSYRFWELASRPESQSDQVKSAILQMLSQIKGQGYGDVLTEDLYLKNPATFRYIVQELAKVSFSDSDHDVKGTAFEYFVRATLKGKKLGQYFTPRPVVEVMAGLVGTEAIVDSLRSAVNVRVGDPACGTGGFLVFQLRKSLQQLDELHSQRKITAEVRKQLAKKLMKDVFHGSDANEGVASAAKMNMIIAGDGHNNIVCENSVAIGASIWPMGDELYDYILTNPPFGTTEGDALSRSDAARYPVPGGKGQHLFIQRMVMATKPGGLICTVIDNGLLNTDGGVELRRWVMQRAKVLAVVQLPRVTFAPNKINVKSSILLLQKRAIEDTDLLDSDPISFVELDTLGYIGTGERIRGFDFEALLSSVVSGALDRNLGSTRGGAHWRAFDVAATAVAGDLTSRWDLKYWEPVVVEKTMQALTAGAVTVKELNQIDTRRGKSPAAATYVDETDGYAVVVKAGSNITRYGRLDLDGADWIEKAGFDDMADAAKLRKGDVLLASTGDGTLGKATVWDYDLPAVADGHVTIIRVDPLVVDPYYLADYLRAGFGAAQIERFYTGSTGLIELSTDHVDRIVVSLVDGPAEQSALSKALRLAEDNHLSTLETAAGALTDGRRAFGEATTR